MKKYTDMSLQERQAEYAAVQAEYEKLKAMGVPYRARPDGTLLVGRELLARLENVTLAIHDHESECCGFGGTFSIKQPEISGAMVEDKVTALKATGAERVISADCGCLMNILGHAAWKDRQEGRNTPSLPGEHIASFLLRRTAK